MGKRGLIAMVIMVVVLSILTMAGCATKKHLLTIEDQKTQLDQANSRIIELQGSIDDLNKNLRETKGVLENTQAEKKQLSSRVSSLNSQVLTLESQKVELEKSVAAGKEFNEQSKKRERNLNSQVNALNKEMTEKGELIASKDSEISSFQIAQAKLKESVASQNQQISTLNDEKNALSAQIQKTVSGKNRLIIILAVLLGIAGIVAVLEYTKLKKRI
ncbi:MAG: hypothetical protein WCC06_02830 [Candidatus Aminicenantales bacterium]